MTLKAGPAASVLVSVGPCPVCGTFAPVLVVVRMADQRLIYFCPGCETAWLERPIFPVLNTVDSLETLAPAGVRLPTQNEAGDLTNIAIVDYESWKEEMDRILRRAS
jgi:hypothetical protein